MPCIDVDGEAVHVTMRRDSHGKQMKLTDEEVEAFKELVRAIRKGIEEKRKQENGNGSR